MDRRSFIARIGAASGLGALGVILGSGAARAQVYDRDSGATADRPGGADPEYYRERIEAETDADAGTLADYRGEGRGPRRTEPTGVTDADTGATKDAAEYGRGPE
jgi:hypothetical protein